MKGYRLLPLAKDIIIRLIRFSEVFLLDSLPQTPSLRGYTKPKTLLAKRMKRPYNKMQGEKIWAEKVVSHTANMTVDLTLTL
jgi:hypothetical protein